MEVTFDTKEIQDTLASNKEISLRNSYDKTISIFHAAPNFEILQKLSHLDLKYDNSQNDVFSIKLDSNKRLVIKKLNIDKISIISIILS